MICPSDMLEWMQFERFVQRCPFYFLVVMVQHDTHLESFFFFFEGFSTLLDSVSEEADRKWGHDMQQRSSAGIEPVAVEVAVIWHAL